MKKFAVFIFAFILLFAQSAFAGPALTKIADNVYSYAGVKDDSPKYSFAANAGIVVGDNGVLVVDTLVSAKEAKRLIQDIRKITDKPIKYAVNTHYHLDHAFGNSEFEKLDAVVISHEKDAKALAETGAETLRDAAMLGLTAEDLAGTRISLPALTFSDRMAIDLGGVAVELVYVAPSHTKGSILVLVPGRKVVFAGDILFKDFHPYLAEGDLEGWVKCLDYIRSLDATAIVPGHGPVCGNKDVEEMKEYLLGFDKKARELASSSSDVDFIVSEIKKALPARSQGGWLLPFNVREKYIK